MQVTGTLKNANLDFLSGKTVAILELNTSDV